MPGSHGEVVPGAGVLGSAASAIAGVDTCVGGALLVEGAGAGVEVAGAEGAGAEGAGTEGAGAEKACPLGTV